MPDEFPKFCGGNSDQPELWPDSLYDPTHAWLDELPALYRDDLTRVVYFIDHRRSTTETEIAQQLALPLFSVSECLRLLGAGYYTYRYDYWEQIQRDERGEYVIFVRTKHSERLQDLLQLLKGDPIEGLPEAAAEHLLSGGKLYEQLHQRYEELTTVQELTRSAAYDTLAEEFKAHGLPRKVLQVYVGRGKKLRQ